MKKKSGPRSALKVFLDTEAVLREDLFKEEELPAPPASFPPLEQPCQACDGFGDRFCECRGRGKLLTEFGEAVIELVTRRAEADLDDQQNHKASLVERRRR